MLSLRGSLSPKEPRQAAPITLPPPETPPLRGGAHRQKTACGPAGPVASLRTLCWHPFKITWVHLFISLFISLLTARPYSLIPGFVPGSPAWRRRSGVKTSQVRIFLFTGDASRPPVRSTVAG